MKLDKIQMIMQLDKTQKSTDKKFSKLKRYAAVENSKDKKQTTQKIKRGRKLKKHAAVAAPSQSPSPTPSSTDECRL